MKAVAIGGGHGTAVTLRALRSLTSDVTAIVSVADNGGSSGRLRDQLQVPAVGDLRKCLSALADPQSPLTQHFEHRFQSGELTDHALGHLLLAGFIDGCGDLETSVREVGELLRITGTVIPASIEAVDLVATTSFGSKSGQTEIAASSSISLVATTPSTVRAPLSAISAILRADLVVIGPGSLYTSVLAACVVPGILDALRTTPAHRVLVANLHAEQPESARHSLTDHLDAIRRHGVTIDTVLVAKQGTLVASTEDGTVNVADLAGGNGRVHDAAKLARSLCQLVA